MALTCNTPKEFSDSSWRTRAKCEYTSPMITSETTESLFSRGPNGGENGRRVAFDVKSLIRWRCAGAGA